MLNFQQNKFLKSSILIILFFIIVLYLVKPVKINGTSMEPTLTNNSWVIINKLSYITSTPQRGDIIVFVLPRLKNTYFIKRVIAIENDLIQIIDGRVYINNSQVQEKYIKYNSNSNFYKRSVPKDNVFVLGDNRIISKDSRYEEIGFINLENIVGKVIY